MSFPRFAINQDGIKMGTISSSDIIFATLTRHGQQIASYRFSGLTTMNQIISYIRRISALSPGLLKLSLRNHSQGWSHIKAINILPDRQPMQLLLPF